MYITFTLKNQIIKRTDKNIVVANSKNYLRAKFTFLTDDWGGTVTGIFNGFTAILDKNNECVVPWEALQFPGELTVSAFCGDRQTANKVYLPIMESGYIVRQTPEPPTPDVYQQLIDIAKNAESVANSVREDADAGKFDGKPGTPGKDAPQINDTQASPDHPWSGAKVDQEVKQLSDQIGNVNKEVADAREGYFGEQYDSLCERIDGDINNVLDKVNVMAYEGTSFHATNTYARNLNVNRNKVEILGQTIQNCLDHSSVDKFGLLNGIVSDGWIEISADGNFKNFRTLTDSVVAKPNTKYTFVVEVAEQSLQTGSGSYICFGETSAEANQPSLFVDQKIFMASNPLRVGINKFVLTTKSNFDGVFCADRGFISSSVISGSIKFRYMIIEGDWTNKDISWVPFGLNTPQTTEIIMENGDASERNAVTIRGPLGSVSDTIRDRVYLKDGKAYYEQNVASAVFDGSEDENWSAYTQQGMPNTYICTGILGQIGKVAIPFSCISDRYARKYNFTMQNNGVANGAKDIVIRDDNYTTVENFVDYLQGSPITVIYQLATPITTEIQLSDFYSYEEQTNWYTTNAVKPTLKAEIPSNIGAVVRALAIENAQLKKSNLSMYQEMDGRMAAMEGTIPIMAEAANNLAEEDAAYHEGVNSI